MKFLFIWTHFLMFMQSVNIYRGLAIILIVANHTYNIANIKMDNFAERLFCSLVGGSTTIFVFISGFIFHHVFYPNFNFLKYFNVRVFRLLIPYLILTILPIAYIMYSGRHFSSYFAPRGTGFIDEYVIPVTKYLVTGRAMTAYWYIPFAVLMALFTPLHLAFIKSNSRVQVYVLGITLAGAAVIQRPEGNINQLQHVAYFTGPYLMGVWCSINREKLYEKLCGREWLLGMAAVGLAAVQAALGLHDAFHKPAFQWGGLDLTLMQKVAFSVFFLVFLHRFEHFQARTISAIAKVSFAIFFIHPWLTRVIKELEIRQGFTQESWILYFMATIAIVAASVGLAHLCRAVVGPRSKYLIGYQPA